MRGGVRRGARRRAFRCFGGLVLARIHGGEWRRRGNLVRVPGGGIVIVLF